MSVKSKTNCLLYSVLWSGVVVSVEDFVTLDFIPSGVDLNPILPVLAKVFDQALEGGGAKNINFQELAADLAQITFDYPFRIPPYFALIIRAIGVLEVLLRVGAQTVYSRLLVCVRNEPLK